ncbi:PspC domain-containing protein [Nocardia camponoti]|uniref:Phage shock protein PspC N-terminal domain-containing protein n=1 Tax=Nocardia camponoti TaxID=1616106 RepID=A0A917QLR9_9NOCA|nr:PspC domain-containing protein [Nocardia camponoti]GGK56795.1 hypothetical protein GCM10011591_31170 [Nocardia camponoti]
MSRTSFGDQLQQMWHTRPVRLPRQGPIAGVAAGFGRRYGVDPVLVRVAFVVSTIFGGAGIVLYLLAWLVLGSAGNEPSPAEAWNGHPHGSHSQTKTIVLIVALAIAVSTMGPMGLGLGGSGVISMGLMLGGWWLLYLRRPELPPGADSYPSTGVGATGYPGAAYPTTVGTRDPYTGYSPYTNLPDAYEPEPVMHVDAADTVVLHKPDESQDATAVLARPTAEPTALAQPHTDSAASSPAATNSPTDLVKHQADSTANPTADLAKQPTAADPATADELGSTAQPDVATNTTDSESPTRDQAVNAVDITKLPPAEPDQARPDQADATNDGTPSPDPITWHKLAPQRDPNAHAEVPHGWDPLAVAPLAWELPEPAPQYAVAVQPAPKRPRSRLTPITIGLAIIAAAMAGGAAAAGVEWMTPARIAAIALAVVGIGLVVGAFFHRGYGLLVLIGPLAGFVLLAGLIGPINFNDGSIGDQKWAPTSVSELKSRYVMKMGSGTLDLRNLNLTENRRVEVEVNVGEAKVLLPEGMTVQTTCNILDDNSSRCVDGLSGPKTPGAPVLDLHVSVHVGDAEVSRG